MEIPPNTKVTDLPASVFWFDESGILCSITKNTAAPSFDETKRIIEHFKQLIGNRKVCILLDVTNSPPNTKETRDYMSAEMPKFSKAVGIISGSAFGMMVANIFFGLKKQPYPVKMFTDERVAKKWLKQFL
mgnify:CR=1 FL=1